MACHQVRCPVRPASPASPAGGPTHLRTAGRTLHERDDSRLRDLEQERQKTGRRQVNRRVIVPRDRAWATSSTASLTELTPATTLDKPRRPHSSHVPYRLALQTDRRALT